MKRVRLLSYAINGRGMGHLVRQLAILRQVRRVCALLGVQAECWVLTSSEADTLARREGFPSIKIPSKAMLRDGGLDPQAFLATIRGTVLQAVASLRPDVLVADTFPGGSVGELVTALELAPRRVLVARRVRQALSEEAAWQALLPLYHRVIEPDERGTGPVLIRDRAELLPRDQARRALGVGEGRAVYLTLGGGGDLSAPGALPRLARRLRDRGWHVVVGAGPLYQGEEVHGPGLTWLSRAVPMELLPGVDAAVSAAGYNSFHELMHVGLPTVFLPQPRIADDQAERAHRAVAAGAGRLAGDLDAVPDLLDALLEDPGSARAAAELVPRNGALAAALAVLEGVLPESDLAMAGRALRPDLLASLRRVADPSRPPGEELSQALDLLRILAGGPPSAQGERAALLAELHDQGLAPAPSRPPDPAALLRAFVQLCEEHRVPLDAAVPLLRALDRKFPGARGPALVAACQALLPALARFDDWMGAHSLLRAVPVQRGSTSGGSSPGGAAAVEAFAAQVAAWLAHEEDLFDALRRFSHLEGNGRRPVGEVLALLQAEGPS
ncbi:hypothetical protein L6R53_27415 [Myxococcota bacterium]|nr:hypothetical protein [Myxococcota bacterium]